MHAHACMRILRKWHDDDVLCGIHITHKHMYIYDVCILKYTIHLFTIIMHFSRLQKGRIFNVDCYGRFKKQ